MQIVDNEYPATWIAVLLLLALGITTSDRVCAQLTLRANHAGAGLHAMTGDAFTLRGTAGQAAVLRRTSSHSLSSGFWFSAAGLVDVGVENPNGALSGLPESARVSALYPNPAMNRATFSITVPTPGVRIDASVYDVMGRRVSAGLQSGASVGSETYDIDLEGLSPGIYFLRVAVNDVVFSRRFVVVGD